MPLTVNNIIWMCFVFVVMLFFIISAFIGEKKNGWQDDDEE